MRTPGPYRRRCNQFLPAETLLPPVVTLLFLLICYMLIPAAGNRAGEEYCTCGVRLGHQTVPDLAGPDPVEPGWILKLGSKSAWILGVEVKASNMDAHLPEIPKRGQPPVLTLKVHRDLQVHQLINYLRALRHDGYTELSLLVRRVERRRFYRSPYSAVRVSLRPDDSPGAEPVVAYNSSSFNEVARAAIQIRRQRPVARIDLDTHRRVVPMFPPPRVAARQRGEAALQLY